ncbi:MULTISPECIES: hypothetical protein [unclassified Streptomyces]|uniref:hypothetical protein n=1 Tax=unclassified Streptomyces TaxID=2593676 RepID=UPI002556816B|nr:MULTISPECIES: hypothetical protein [unclassified Streptomyces]WRZ67590.1 hypothetical protein OG408_28515 [Streptomyces sp. NBC_01257]WSU61577.1 hypothetical protein OG450_28645 [Streptomyces sp. NBC_01104]
MTRPTRWTRPLLTRRPPGSHTRRLLERHLAVMAVTAVVSMTALLVSYWSVQTAAGEMRTRAAPAVQLVASTQLALLRAHEEAELSADRRIDQVVGAGARYENQLSAADQGLSRLSDVQIDGERGRGVLNTASALLTSYSSSITPGAVKYVRDEDDLMQKEKFTEAETLLVRPGTGVVPRLDVLQDHQMRRMDRVSSLGTLQQSGWAVAELGLLVLAVTALSALWVLRTRCGRSRDPWLLAALLVTLALAVVPLWATVHTQERLDTARHRLVAIEERAHDETDLAESQRDVTDKSTDLRGVLAAHRWQSGTYYGALGGAVLIVLLPAVGIVRRLNADYWRAG